MFTNKNHHKTIAGLYETLTHKSAIAVFEVGLSYTFKSPLKANASLGYNAITGNGKSGAGTLYPVFSQLSVTYNLTKLFSK